MAALPTPARGCRAGRVGLSLRALPVILPVGFRFHGDAVLVWGPGLEGVPAAQLAGNVVAFQTDGSDPDTGQTWSLHVQGVATSARGDPVPHVRISLEILTCRHFDGPLELGRDVGSMGPSPSPKGPSGLPPRPSRA